MPRLLPGQIAPEFESADLFDTPISLAKYAGRPVLLSFYRYASCPLCNMRVRSMIVAHDRLAAKGLAVIAVFQSPAKTMLDYVGQQDCPFPLIPDPKMIHYRRWGVETGWGGFFAAGMRIGTVLEAARTGFPPGKVDGPIHRLPADFLIDPFGRLEVCYYGQDVGDHLSLQHIEQRLSQWQTPANVSSIPPAA